MFYGHISSVFGQMRHQRAYLGYLGIAYNHWGLRLKYLTSLAVTHVTLPRSSQNSNGFTFICNSVKLD